METSTPLIWIARDKTYLKDWVQLKKLTYDVHIINEARRKELEGEEETLKDVIERPQLIVRDKDYESRIHYAGLRYLNSIESYHYVGVCVEMGDRPYDVVTAITCRRIPSWVTPGGVIYDSMR